MVGHLYTEFYLEDADGQGYWFPCQPAGNREFGGIAEMRPDPAQRGQLPSARKAPRAAALLSEYLTGAGGKPSCKFTRQIVN